MKMWRAAFSHPHSMSTLQLTTSTTKTAPKSTAQIDSRAAFLSFLLRVGSSMPLRSCSSASRPEFEEVHGSIGKDVDRKAQPRSLHSSMQGHSEDIGQGEKDQPVGHDLDAHDEHGGSARLESVRKNDSGAVEHLRHPCDLQDRTGHFDHAVVVRDDQKHRVRDRNEDDSDRDSEYGRELGCLIAVGMGEPFVSLADRLADEGLPCDPEPETGHQRDEEPGDDHLACGLVDRSDDSGNRDKYKEAEQDKDVLQGNRHGDFDDLRNNIP